MTDIERILSHTTITDHGLMWCGSINVRNGYGQIRARRDDGTRTVKQVHRLWYELTQGKIPTGYDVDHYCRVRICLTHLRTMPKKANRGESAFYRWKAHRERLDADRRTFRVA